jgi:hypothetical protein
LSSIYIRENVITPASAGKIGEINKVKVKIRRTSMQTRASTKIWILMMHNQKSH